MSHDPDDHCVLMVIELYKEEYTLVYNIGVWKLLLNSLCNHYL